MSRVLVVDDELNLARALAITLRAQGHQVETASDGASALSAVTRRPPDLMILDLGLPDLDGGQVVLAVRGWSSVPILVLSARHDQTQKVAALDAGADDYITKPFSMDELLARVRAALRRGAPREEQAPVVQTGAFVVDLAGRRVLAAGTEVRLTPTEWHLVEVLARNVGRLVTQRQLLQEVWGPTYGTETNYLRVYVAQLRRKLEPDPGRPRHIVTEPGVGYRLEP